MSLSGIRQRSRLLNSHLQLQSISSSIQILQVLCGTQAPEIFLRNVCLMGKLALTSILLWRWFPLLSRGRRLLPWNAWSGWLLWIPEKLPVRKRGCNQNYLTWKLAKIVSQRKRLLLGSIPVLGSSRRTIFGFPTIAMAKLSFRLVPPEHIFTCLSACSWICNPLKYRG